LDFTNATRKGVREGHKTVAVNTEKCLLKSEGKLLETKGLMYNRILEIPAKNRDF
jgi:hypothetical protein